MFRLNTAITYPRTGVSKRFSKRAKFYHVKVPFTMARGPAFPSGTLRLTQSGRFV